MNETLLFGLLWIVITLGVAGSAAYLAKLRGSSVLIATYTGLVVISITTATKMISFPLPFWGDVFVPAGVVVYSASFLITDLISEHYGKEKAQTAVWTGFFVMLSFFLYSWVTVEWKGAPFWNMQKSYEDIMGLSARIALAGAVAFIFSQLTDVTIYHLLKNRLGSGNVKIAIRNNVSTWISQAIDTVVFISIAFYGVFPIVELMIAQYILKVIIAMFDTCFLIFGVSILRNAKED